MYTVAKVKSFMGMDCPGFNATLLRNGKKVAEVIQDGSGGETMVHWASGQESDLFAAFLLGKTYTFNGAVENHNTETMIGQLVDDFENKKKIKRWCKTQTVFRVAGDQDGTYRTLKTIYCPKTVEFIRQKYGNTIVELYDEKGEIVQLPA